MWHRIIRSETPTRQCPHIGQEFQPSVAHHVALKQLRDNKIIHSNEIVMVMRSPSCTPASASRIDAGDQVRILYRVSRIKLSSGRARHVTFKSSSLNANFNGTKKIFRARLNHYMKLNNQFHQSGFIFISSCFRD